MTAQPASASTQVTSGASRNTPWLAPAGMTGSLSRNFKQIGEGLQQAPGPDHVGAAPDLHRGPDLAVGQKNIGDGNQKDDKQQQALRDHDHQRPKIGPPEVDQRHRVLYSAAVMVERPSAIAEHSAITAEAARDRIGEVEIVDARTERRLVDACRRAPASFECRR